MRKFRLLISAVSALAMSGCFTVRYATLAPPGGAHHEEGADFFFWGLVGHKVVNLDTICPQGVSHWRNQATFLNAILFLITLGIYSPRTIVVECADGRAYRMTPEMKSNLLADADR